MFDDDLEDYKFTINDSYAKKFEHNNKREELHRLQEKYGKNAVLEEDSETDTDEDEDAMYDTVENDKTFLRILSKLKNKDPDIYDHSKTWFNEVEEKEKKEEKHKPMFLKDYERETLLKKGSLVVDSDEEEGPSQTYTEEQRTLKEDLKRALDEGEEEEGQLLTLRTKTQDEQKKEDNDYRLWLKGDKGKVKDKNMRNDCAKLREEWTNPDLDESEKFLRDFILNKGWMDKDAQNKHVVPSYDEIIGDDDDDVEEHERFERKFNFRYEEPNSDLIKNYPRTIANSVRKTDEKRKEQRKRKEERKLKEKAEKKLEIEMLKKLKLEEIENKIKKLSDSAGRNLDKLKPELDNDFEPAEHDKMMSSLFGDDYYTQELHTKPVFSDSDEDLINDEEWYNKLTQGQQAEEKEDVKEETEQNMAEEEDEANVIYREESEELTKNNKKSWKRKRSKKFKEAVTKPKPLFNPDEQTFEKYYDEYYALDCEDIVGGTNCRFNYRQTKPSTYGLTVEEILKADDKELNQWFSLKKIVKYRTPHQEEKDEKKFSNKQHNNFMKKKLLLSLNPKPEESSKKTNLGQDKSPSEPLKKKKKEERILEEKPKKSKKSKTISTNRREAYGL